MKWNSNSKTKHNAADVRTQVEEIILKENSSQKNQESTPPSEGFPFELQLNHNTEDYKSYA